MNEEKHRFYQDFVKKEKPEDEDDDQNFIKKDEKKSFEEIRNEVAAGLASEVKNVVAKLNGLLRTKKTQERNLDRETGGLEVDYTKTIGDGKDVWDNQAKNIMQTANQVDANEFDGAQNRSFTFKKKRERLGRKKHHNKDHAENSLSYAQALKQARADNKSNDNGFSR